MAYVVWWNDQTLKQTHSFKLLWNFVECHGDIWRWGTAKKYNHKISLHLDASKTIDVLQPSQVALRSTLLMPVEPPEGKPSGKIMKHVVEQCLASSLTHLGSCPRRKLQTWFSHLFSIVFPIHLLCCPCALRSFDLFVPFASFGMLSSSRPYRHLQTRRPHPAREREKERRSLWCYMFFTCFRGEALLIWLSYKKS